MLMTLFSLFKTVWKGPESLNSFCVCLKTCLVLKSIFTKVKFIVWENAKEIEDLYADIFTCPIGNLPMKYLGGPIDNKNLNKKTLVLHGVEKARWLARQILEFWWKIDFVK